VSKTAVPANEPEPWLGPREQQTPEAVRTFHKEEIAKRRLIAKAVIIK
jgi:hypothetical protein